MSEIVWLASYPKSGNTWFRVFLTNLLHDGPAPADINALRRGTIACDRGLFDRTLGVSTGHLTAHELLRLRPRVYAAWAARADETVFCKIHDAFAYTPSGAPMVPPEATRGVLYFVRNPLDVCASYAAHLPCSIEEAVGYLLDADHALADETDTILLQLRQPLSTWAGHVRSWTRQTDVPVHVVRYEDMKARPLETFAAAARFAGLDAPEAAVARALDHSRFERLQAQEAAEGFHERSPRAARFFRRGVVGGWRDELSPAQARRLIAALGEEMRRWGYEEALEA